MSGVTGECPLQTPQKHARKRKTRFTPHDTSTGTESHHDTPRPLQMGMGSSLMTPPLERNHPLVQELLWLTDTYVSFSFFGGGARSVEELPSKTPIYSTLLCLLSLENGEFVHRVLNTVVSAFEDHLEAQEWEQCRLLVCTCSSLAPMVVHSLARQLCHGQGLLLWCQNQVMVVGPLPKCLCLHFFFCFFLLLVGWDLHSLPTGPLLVRAWQLQCHPL